MKGVSKTGSYRKFSPTIDAVAKEVVDTVSQGKPVVMSKILLRHGYSVAMSKSPKTLTKGKQYQEAIQTYTARLEKHRANVLFAMEKKNLEEEQYRTLADAQSKLTHDVQLLTGGKTENVQLTEDRNMLVAILADIRKSDEPEQLYEGHPEL